MLLRFGYRLKIMNTINFKKSMHYNPFAYIHSEKDILKLVTVLIANTKGEGKAGDDFWVKAETLLYTALIGYIHYEAPVEEQNFSTLIAKGNNGIVKTKYLTFGIDADNIRVAKTRLERIETDIINNFKRLGVAAEVLNGHDRLKVLHDILRMDSLEPFHFSWDWLPRTGLSTKDFIAPSSFLFNRAKDFRMGKKFASVSFLQILAPELSDRVLKDFLDIESNIIVNLHVQSVDQVSAIKTIKRTITDLDKSKIEEQKKAGENGTVRYR